MFDNLNEIDECIYNMIKYHTLNDVLFINADEPKRLKVGFISHEDDGAHFTIRMAHIKMRKRSRILDGLGIGTEQLYTSTGRVFVVNQLTNKNHPKYIPLEQMKNVIIMNEALE